MYCVIGRAFQNHSIVKRAFPAALSSCRGVTAVYVNNSVGVFNVNWNAGRRDYHKWTRTSVENQLLSRSTNNLTVPKRQSSSGDHVTLWTAERVLSGALVPLVPMAFLMPTQPLEYLLAFLLTIHSHWGIEAIVVDYVRPSVFGNTIPKLALTAVYGLSVMTLGGLFYFIYADVGLVTAIKMLWKL